MIIEISKIGSEGSRYDGKEDAAILGVEGDPGLRVGEPLEHHLFVSRLGNQVLVRGRVRIRMELRCARCGRFFSTIVEDSSFLRDYLVREGQRDLDITADLREAVLLVIPPHPVCRPDCAGLCPQCGRDLNEGPCGCRPPEARGVWSALDGLEL